VGSVSRSLFSVQLISNVNNLFHTTGILLHNQICPVFHTILLEAYAFANDIHYFCGRSNKLPLALQLERFTSLQGIFWIIGKVALMLLLHISSKQQINDDKLLPEFITHIIFIHQC